MVEWLRWTIYLTMALVSVNLMTVFYILSLNILFGVVALIVGLGTIFGSDGSKCRETNQVDRGNYLMNQWIVLVLLIPFSCAHFLYLAIKGKNWCNEVYN